MRTALLIASLALVASPAFAEPPQAPVTERKPTRLRLAGAIGTGYVTQLDCSGCPRFHGGGPAFSFEMGMRLSPALAWVGRFTSTFVPFADDTGARMVDFAPGLLWWFNDRVWLSGTVGIGELFLGRGNFPLGDDFNQPEPAPRSWRGVGLTAGAAIAADVVHMRDAGVYAELRALTLVTGRFRTTNGSLLLGFWLR
jgi:hypothetical protein